jgi:hypothetical protein
MLHKWENAYLLSYVYKLINLLFDSLLLTDVYAFSTSIILY